MELHCDLFRETIHAITHVLFGKIECCIPLHEFVPAKDNLCYQYNSLSVVWLKKKIHCKVKYCDTQNLRINENTQNKLKEMFKVIR